MDRLPRSAQLEFRELLDQFCTQEMAQVQPVSPDQLVLRVHLGRSPQHLEQLGRPGLQEFVDLVYKEQLVQLVSQVIWAILDARERLGQQGLSVFMVLPDSRALRGLLAPMVTQGELEVPGSPDRLATMDQQFC